MPVTCNIVHATVTALKSLEEPSAVAARRGLPIEDVVPEQILRIQAATAKADATANAGV